MKRSVRVLDADPQHSMVAWAEQGDGLLARLVEKVEGGAGTLRTRVRQAEKDADIVLIDTPPGAPEIAYEAALAADLMLLPCGPSPLDLFALKEVLSLALQARAERRAKKPRIRFVPSKVVMSTNLGRGLASSLKDMGKKVLPGIGQRSIGVELAQCCRSTIFFLISAMARAGFRSFGHTSVQFMIVWQRYSLKGSFS